jgi:hypothetical protein
VTRTTSVTLPIVPAVYWPLAESIVPPELLAPNDQTSSASLPPLAVNVRLSLGASVAVAGVIDTPAVTVTLTVAVFPRESVTRTTSVTLPMEPAVYSPVAPSIVAPEALAASDHAQLDWLPPAAVNVWLAFGASVTADGVIDTPAVTVTLTVAAFPSESTTWTTSVTLPVEPAVYWPLAESIVPPEALVASDQTNPASLPPLAVNVRLALGASVAVDGEVDTPAVTVTFTVAVFPSESVTRTTSVTLPVEPAV